MAPQLIYGDIRGIDASELKPVLQDAGIRRLDTAARYMNGESEKQIGRAALGESFLIDTKILCRTAGNGDLTPEAIEKSLSNSLDVMKMEKVNVLYCHVPDKVTPIAEQAKAFDEQYRNGRYTHLGVSNFPPSMVEEWLLIADTEGYIKPSVYQGQYNLVCRGFESSLLPLLRKNNIAFAAFSPLAGGFLLGNYTTEGLQTGTRFSVASPFLGWYDQPTMHEGIKRLRTLAAETDSSMDELALRWLFHHSALGEQDAVILGGSKISHVKGALAKIEKGSLNEAIVEKLNDLWDLVKAEASKITDDL